jgi:hypothetical protein
VTPKIHSVFVLPAAHAPSKLARLSLLGLGCSLPDFETPLLLENHNLESVEIGKRPSLVRSGDTLGERRLLPFLGDPLLLPELGDGTGAGTTGQRPEDDIGQAEMGERERLARDGGIRGVNQDLRLD